MAPATIAGASVRAGTQGPGWTRETIIIAIQEWVAAYGQPPRAADWNPSSAKWAGQLWRVERYRAGRADGSPWPALNTAKRPFGGSLNAAIRAAGFEPARPGPRRRSDVDPEQAHRVDMSPEARAMLAAARAEARAAERRIALLEARLARRGPAGGREAAGGGAAAGGNAAGGGGAGDAGGREAAGAAVARAERRAAGAVARAEARAGEARAAAAEARMDAAEARGAAKRLASRLERAEATIATLRAERRELKLAAGRLADRLAATGRMLERARRDAARAQADTAGHRREWPARAVRSSAACDRSCAADAELRAARAERELRETVAALRGDAQRLSAAELAELRCDGPAGPAALAAALRELAAARGASNPVRLRGALRRVAQAAVGWQRRL